MIMHAWNNNSKQKERLSKEQFAAVMKIARELETQQKDLYFEWKIWYDNKKLNRDHCDGWKEKKMMKELLPDQWFHANMIYVKN